MTTTLRPAVTDDLPLLLGYMRGYYEHDHIDLDEQAARNALERPMKDAETGRVWLIEESGRPVGYVVALFGWSLEFHGRDAFLDELFIDPEFRGRGTGTRAMALVESELRGAGVRAMHLEVERGNAGAQRFYASLGFEDRSRFFMMSKRFPAGKSAAGDTT
ncbi:MAG TPA: GNAT family N-acetyltransferase [Gammaproteobacteria bacterium]|jgi:ribosomal protein S18 acetylase RimI-like enzyme